MKILIVSGTFPPRQFGGVTASTFKLATSLQQLGHNVTVYTTDTGNDEQTRLDVPFQSEIGGVNVFYFRNISNKFAFRSRLYIPISLFFHLRSLKDTFDIIEIRDFRSVMSIFLHTYARKNNIPYIIQARGSLTYEEGNTLFKKLFDLLWGKKIIRDASKIIAQSITEANQYRQFGVPSGTIEIIPNWVDTLQYQMLPEEGCFRKAFSFRPNKKLILSLGRLNKIKGIDLLLTAFSQVRHHMSAVQLIIAGPDDGDLMRLKKLTEQLGISSDVFFIGPLTGKLKIAAYAESDVFVLPSQYDAFPNTVIESLACGTPVIATAGCQIADIIREAGIVVDRTEEDLKTAMMTLINDDALAKELGKKGRKMVFDQYSQDIIIRQIEDLYQECVGEKQDYQSKRNDDQKPITD